MDARIEKFLLKHHVLTLASVNDKGEPYCANLFYVYLPDIHSFVFTSSEDTRHGSDMLANERVAASVVLETTVVGKLQGAQITGRVSRTDKYKRDYLKKYPFAVLAELELWVLRADFIKFTDNRLGFGKKLIWKENE